ncbi:MAG: hypothetical protein GY920_00825 [Aliivibrio sp.]|nr:hypothetical protein [Aliivibrio sp.]
MRTYNNSIVIKFDTTATGNAGAGKPVTVYEAGTVTKAELFNAAEQTITNPINADNEGNYSFKVANGIYDIVIDQGLPTQVKIENELITDAAGGGSGSSAIETIQLTSGQVLVQFTVNTEGASFYINGTGADNGRILESVNYSYNQSLNQVTLTNSYPSGTYISAIRDTGYINEDYVRYFDELSDAVTSTKLADGDKIYLEDRTAGNGGGGMWSVVLASTVTPNNKDIVACTGVPTLALVLRKASYIDAPSWGVNDIDSTQELTNIAEKNTGGIIRFPSGLFTGKFTSFNQYTLGMEGDGEVSTFLVTPLSSDSAFTVPATKEFRSTTIKSMAFYQEGFATQSVGTGKGIDLTDAVTTVNAHFQDISLNWFGVGYESSSNAFSNQLDNVRANFCGESFRFVGSGQLINHTINNCYSSQPTVNGLFMSGCKNFVFNAYNSGSAGAPHVNIALGSFGIIFNSPNFEQDTGTLGTNTEAIRCQSDSEVTFNYPTFAAPSAVDSTTYLFRAMNTAVVYINDPKIIGADANIQHILVQDNAVVYLNDPKNVIDDAKVTLIGNGKLIRTDRVIANGFTAFGKISNHTAGANISTGLTTVPVDYEVAIDFASIGDAVLTIEPQVTALGTGTMKVRYLNTATGAENFNPYDIIWKAR